MFKTLRFGGVLNVQYILSKSKTNSKKNTETNKTTGTWREKITWLKCETRKNKEHKKTPGDPDYGVIRDNKITMLNMLKEIKKNQELWQTIQNKTITTTRTK